MRVRSCEVPGTGIVVDIDRNSSVGRAGHGLARVQRQAARSAVVCIAKPTVGFKKTPKADVEVHKLISSLNLKSSREEALVPQVGRVNGLG